MTTPTPATTAPCPSPAAAASPPSCSRKPANSAARDARPWPRPSVAGGLASYYQHRSEASRQPRGACRCNWSMNWRCTTAPTCSNPSFATKANWPKPRSLMEGISCAACGWLIEKHLRALPAVAEARLNLSNHRLHVRWADAQLPLSQVLAELRHIGYAAHPYSSRSRQRTTGQRKSPGPAPTWRGRAVVVPGDDGDHGYHGRNSTSTSAPSCTPSCAGSRCSSPHRSCSTAVRRSSRAPCATCAPAT